MNWWIVRGISGRPPILNHLLIGFPEQCDCLSNFTTIASKTIKCQTSATRRYTQYYYFFLYAPYKSDTGVFSNIWISFLCALCSLKISARLLPPKARPIPVAAAESNVNCGMASEAIPNVAVPAKINPDEIFFFFEFLMADSCDFIYLRNHHATISQCSGSYHVYIVSHVIVENSVVNNSLR